MAAWNFGTWVLVLHSRERCLLLERGALLTLLFYEVYCTGWQVMFFVRRCTIVLIGLETVQLKLLALPTDGRVFRYHSSI